MKLFLKALKEPYEYLIDQNRVETYIEWIASPPSAPRSLSLFDLYPGPIWRGILEPLPVWLQADRELAHPG